MSDLIERLRDLHRRYSGGVGDEAADGCDDAADEIERLRKEWERECSDGDAVLHAAGLTPADYRTDGGSMNVPKIFGALLTKEVELRTEIERLRRELVEARTLLREARQRGMLDGGDGVYDRIDAFLAEEKKDE